MLVQRAASCSGILQELELTLLLHWNATYFPAVAILTSKPCGRPCHLKTRLRTPSVIHQGTVYSHRITSLCDKLAWIDVDTACCKPTCLKIRARGKLSYFSSELKKTARACALAMPSIYGWKWQATAISVTRPTTTTNRTLLLSLECALPADFDAVSVAAVIGCWCIHPVMRLLCTEYVGTIRWLYRQLSKVKFQFKLQFLMWKLQKIFARAQRSRCHTIRLDYGWAEKPGCWNLTSAEKV